MDAYGWTSPAPTAAGRDCCSRTEPPVRALGRGRGHGSTCCSLRSVKMIRAFTSESPNVSNNTRKSCFFWKKVARGNWKLAKYSAKVAKLAALLWLVLTECRHVSAPRQRLKKGHSEMLEVFLLYFWWFKLQLIIYRVFCCVGSSVALWTAASIWSRLIARLQTIRLVFFSVLNLTSNRKCGCLTLSSIISFWLLLKKLRPSRESENVCITQKKLFSSGRQQSQAQLTI